MPPSLFSVNRDALPRLPVHFLPREFSSGGLHGFSGERTRPLSPPFVLFSSSHRERKRERGQEISGHFLSSVGVFLSSCSRPLEVPFHLCLSCLFKDFCFQLLILAKASPTQSSCLSKMSKLSAFFEKKKKKSLKTAVPSGMLEEKPVWLSSFLSIHIEVCDCFGLSCHSLGDRIRRPRGHGDTALCTRRARRIVSFSGEFSSAGPSSSEVKKERAAFVGACHREDGSIRCLISIP